MFARLINLAQQVLDEDLDYSPHAGAILPEGFGLFSYPDGVWLVDRNLSCDMNKAVKIHCLVKREN